MHKLIIESVSSSSIWAGHTIWKPIISLKVLLFSFTEKKKEKRVIATAWPVILSHHQCSVILQRQSKHHLQSNTNNSHTQCDDCLLLPRCRGAPVHIPQPKRASNTNKVVGGERVWVCVPCVHMYKERCLQPCVPSCCLCRCYKQASLTRCVIEILYKVISELQTALILIVCFIVSHSVCLCCSVCAYVWVCMSLCYAGHKKLLFQRSLKPPEALFTTQ